MSTEAIECPFTFSLAMTLRINNDIVQPQVVLGSDWFSTFADLMAGRSTYVGAQCVVFLARDTLRGGRSVPVSPSREYPLGCVSLFSLTLSNLFFRQNLMLADFQPCLHYVIYHPCYSLYLLMPMHIHTRMPMLSRRCMPTQALLCSHMLMQIYLGIRLAIVRHTMRVWATTFFQIYLSWPKVFESSQNPPRNPKSVPHPS